LPLGGEALEPLLLEHAHQGGVHLVEALPAVGEGKLEGVERRQQLLDKVLGGALEVLGLLLEDALLVVLEVGLEATERVEVLVSLRGDAGDVGFDDLGGGVERHPLSGERGLGVSGERGLGVGLVRLDGLVAVAHAPCSSTISASTTSSSLGDEVPSVAPAAWPCSVAACS